MTSPRFETDLLDQLLSMERAALKRWGEGDPSGFLEISGEDVVYFDPFLERRVDGKAALTEYYEALRGKIHSDRFELLNPRVQAVADMAVLTFNFVCDLVSGAAAADRREVRWNCTEVYRKGTDGSWRIIQTHWSITKPNG